MDSFSSIVSAEIRSSELRRRHTLWVAKRFTDTDCWWRLPFPLLRLDHRYEERKAGQKKIQNPSTIDTNG